MTKNYLSLFEKHYVDYTGWRMYFEASRKIQRTKNILIKIIKLFKGFFMLK